MTTRKLLIGLTMIMFVALTLTGLRIQYEAHSALPQAGLERSKSSDRLRPKARFRFLTGTSRRAAVLFRDSPPSRISFDSRYGSSAQKPTEVRRKSLDRSDLGSVDSRHTAL